MIPSLLLGNHHVVVVTSFSSAELFCEEPEIFIQDRTPQGCEDYDLCISLHNRKRSWVLGKKFRHDSLASNPGYPLQSLAVLGVCKTGLTLISSMLIFLTLILPFLNL